MTTVDPLACTLALTLLSADEACPVCGYLASEHRGWQREHGHGRERGGLSTKMAQYVETVTGLPADDEVDDGLVGFGSVCVKCDGAKTRASYYGRIPCWDCVPGAKPPSEYGDDKAEPPVEPIVTVPHAWLVMGQAIETIPAGAVIELDPASGQVRCHRPSPAGSSAEDLPSPPPEPGSPPSDV